MMICDGLWFLAAACALLILPLPWVLSAATAAMIHELSHVLAVVLLGGRILTVRVGISGCRIDTDPMGDLKSAASILAGPLGSFLLVMTGRRFPMIAVCGLLQGTYNLLPVLPLDSGRFLCCVLHRICPGTEERIMTVLAAVSGGTVLMAGVLVFLRTEGNWTVLLWSVIFNITTIRRKIPCNDSRIGLQWY